MLGTIDSVIDAWGVRLQVPGSASILKQAWRRVADHKAEDLAIAGAGLTVTTCSGCGSETASPVRTDAPVVRCLGCGLDRLLPRLTAAAAEQMTRAQYDTQFPAEALKGIRLDGSPGYFAFERDQLPRIFPHLKKGSRCFEVGCWGGDFAVMIKELGIESTCIDVWPPAVEQARAQGVDVHCMSFNDLDAVRTLKLSSVDLVVFRDSLQMIQALGEGLTFLKSIASPQCGFYFKCHVSDSAFYTSNAILTRFSVGVHSMFTSFSIVDVLQKHGFDIVAMGGNSHDQRYVNFDRVLIFARLRPS